jgi:hypothetical protein
MALDKYLPSLLALGVAVVTGFFTVLSAYLANRASTRQLSLKLRHESEKDRLEARRERLEELYSLVMAWSKQAASFYFPFLAVMKGDITYNEALDLSIDRKNTIDVDRLFTLAELYFDGGHEKLDEIRQILKKVNSVNEEFKRFYKSGQTSSKEHLRQMSTELTSLDGAIDSYKKALKGYASEL